MKQNLYLVVEGSIIWAAFPERKMARDFRRREFPNLTKFDIRIIPLPVYQTLEEAPTTVGNYLKHAAAW